MSQKTPPDRILMLLVPKYERLANWTGDHPWIPGNEAEVLAELRASLGVLPADLRVEDWSWDIATQTFRVVVSHPRFREFRDGDFLAGHRTDHIRGHGWESVMESR